MTSRAVVETTADFAPEGVIPALVTPIDERQDLDERRLTALVRSVIDAGATAVSVLGSTGEVALLPAALRCRVVEAALRATDGRVPVIAGSLGGAIGDVAEEARNHVSLGATAILASPPSYFVLDQAAVVTYYRELATRVRAPIIVYHFPALTKVTLDPQTVARLAAIDWIVGLKDGSGDRDFFMRTASLLAAERFALLAGSGRMASFAASHGAKGVVAASANIIPAELVQLWTALQHGRSHEADELQASITAIEDICRRYPYPTNWKAAARVVGLECGPPVIPLQDLSGDQFGTLERELGEFAMLRRRQLTRDRVR